MHVMEDSRTGRARRWKPDEIGQIVKLMREVVGLKQDTLAARSHMSVKTLQRVEKGERVQDATLQDLAEALGLDKEEFTRVQMLPDFERLAKEAQELREKLMIVDAIPLTNWRDFENITPVHGTIVDDRSVSPEIAERTAYFRDYLGELIDVVTLASSSQMVDYYKEMMSVVREVQTAGYQAKYAVYRTDDGFNVSVVVFFKADDPQQSALTQMAVGRSYLDMARTSLST